jgi:signal transduction histidine kinase
MGEMVDKAGGQLQISSQPGQGTQIKAILPLVQDQQRS